MVTRPVIIIAETSRIRNMKKSHLFLCRSMVNKLEYQETNIVGNRSYCTTNITMLSEEQRITNN